jgi:hypothetical protein
MQARRDVQRRQIYADTLARCKLLCSRLADGKDVTTDEVNNCIDTFGLLVGKLVGGGASSGSSGGGGGGSSVTTGVQIGNMVPHMRGVSGTAIGKRARSCTENGQTRRTRARSAEAPSSG